jgi:transcriptional regulator with XRE-family HTH domain
MPIRTTAVDAAAARGWTKAELARKTGLSLSTIYSLSDGSQPSAKAIAAIMRVFADLPYERLFVPSDSSLLQRSSRTQEPTAA